MATKDVTDAMVCMAYAQAQKQRGVNWDNDYEYPYIILMRETGECMKVCYAAMERACRHGLIEYGVSLRTGWLTDKGNDLIKEAV